MSLIVTYYTHASIYCKTRKFSGDKFSVISPFKSFFSFNFYSSIAVLFCIIIKVKLLEDFSFHWFASAAEIAKINCKWNFLVLQYLGCAQVKDLFYFVVSIKGTNASSQCKLIRHILWSSFQAQLWICQALVHLITWVSFVWLVLHVDISSSFETWSKKSCLSNTFGVFKRPLKWQKNG